MRILIITQDDPFYLPNALSFFLKKLPVTYKVVGTVLLSGSVRGKKQSFLQKAFDSLRVFGINFFLHYSFKYISVKIFSKLSVRKLMDQNKIPLIELQESINHKRSRQILDDYQADILISVAGNEIFKEPLINLTPNGCLNLHTGKLPLYRGLMPTFWALLNKEKDIGISVFFVDEGIDSGPILVQRSIPIIKRIQSEVIRETKIVGMECIIEALNLIKNGNYKLIPNDVGKATYYSFPTKNDVKAFKKSGARFF